GPEDVAAAEQERDYVNHVFMQQNPGFLVLYSFIKDALLSKVGVVKVWWECRDEVERETYLDQPDDAFALIVSQPGVEVVEHTEREISVPSVVPAQAGTHDLRPVIMGPGSPPAGAGVGRDDGEDGTLSRPKLHDVTIEIRHRGECARVEGAPPEKSATSRRRRWIKAPDYCFHDGSATDRSRTAQAKDAEQT